MDKEEAVAICKAIDNILAVLSDALAISRSHETRIAALENTTLCATTTEGPHRSLPNPDK